MDPSSTTRPARAREEREELLEGGGRAKRAPRLVRPLLPANCRHATELKASKLSRESHVALWPFAA